jgi:hypothetical protein
MRIGRHRCEVSERCFLDRYQGGRMSNQHAVEVREIGKVTEVIRLLGKLQETAYALPAEADRRDALREIRGFQLRAVAFVRCLAS